MSSFLATTPSQLGPILRGYRIQRGLTQQALAARLGLSQKDVSLAEAKPERMSVARLFRFFAVLEVELTLKDRGSSNPAGAEW